MSGRIWIEDGKYVGVCERCGKSLAGRRAILGDHTDPHCASARECRRNSPDQSMPCEQYHDRLLRGVVRLQDATIAFVDKVRVACDGEPFERHDVWRAAERFLRDMREGL